MDPTSQLPESTPTEGETALDPQRAAVLLDQTSRTVQRRFNPHPPVLSAVCAVAVPAIYGALWYSVRGQHPYVGPDLGVIGIVYVVVAVVALISVSIYLRATAGVSGRSRHEDRINGIPMAVALLGIYTFLGGLYHDGFSHAVVYGVVDAAGPWVVVGAALAGLAAAQEDWWKFAAAVALVASGVGAAYAGPINVWGILAVAACVLFLAQTAWRLDRARRQ